MSVELLFGAWDDPRPPRGYPIPEPPDPSYPTSVLYLLANRTWNDYGYRTTFIVHVAIGYGWTVVGSNAIATADQQPGPHTYDLLGMPDVLTSLPPDYFSLGQDLEYYNELVTLLGADRSREVLEVLGDLVVRPREDVDLTTVFDLSLTRTNAALEALEQAPALFGGEAADATTAFAVEIWVKGAAAPHRFNFDFEPSALPRAISVLVGLNGTGKTQSMATLARLLSRVYTAGNQEGELAEPEPRGSVNPRPSIYGVVAVSFSAFDDFVVPKEVTSDRFKYVYCGLRSLQGSTASRDQIVATEVADRFLELGVDDRIRALQPLMPTLDRAEDWASLCVSGDVPFDDFSAGQRIVLSVTSDLVKHVTKRVLVMMDEPEIHLHPQLLSGLMAWVQDLLIERESFAIVATHSPIVVQQVPADSVHVLRRVGDEPATSQPHVETFGANLTEIVREVFEDRAGDRSYQEVLEKLWREYGSADAVLELFEHRLGMNAEIYLRSLDAG